MGVVARTRDTNWANLFPLSGVANSTCRILPVWYGARRSRVPSPAAGIPRGAAPPTAAAAGKGELVPSSLSRQNLFLPSPSRFLGTLSPAGRVTSLLGASGSSSSTRRRSSTCPSPPISSAAPSSAASTSDSGRSYRTAAASQTVLLSSVFPISS